MLIIADTHVHVYPCYNVERVLEAAFANLNTLCAAFRSQNGKPESKVKMKALFLTERHDCSFFEQLREGRIDLGTGGYQLHDHGSDALLVTAPKSEETIAVIPGRQWVTKERIEILGLMVNDRIDEGLPADELMNRILQAGGIPVLPWSPGKWTLRRGALVRRLIDQFDPGRILIGDTRMRPAIWPEPALMRRARRRGVRVVAGSDPLPFAGEECRVGSYGVVGELDFNWRDLKGSFRTLLLDPQLRLACVGQRGSVREAWRRWKTLRGIPQAPIASAVAACSA